MVGQYFMETKFVSIKYKIFNIYNCNKLGCDLQN